MGKPYFKNFLRMSLQVSMTALAAAAASNNTAMTELLLSLGARVDPLDDGGATPLFRASNAGLANICAVLVSHGANVAFRHKVAILPLWII